MKKLLDSDWLRAVQFKYDTGTKSVTPLQNTHGNSGYDTLKDIDHFHKWRLF